MSIARTLLTKLQRIQPEEPSEADAEHAHDSRRLSNRERAILEQLTHGASTKHIARALNASEGTVRIHLWSLLRKLGVTNRTEAAMLGMQKGKTLFL